MAKGLSREVWPFLIEVVAVAIPIRVIHAEEGAREGTDLAEGHQHRGMDLARRGYPQAHEQQGHARHAQESRYPQMISHIFSIEN